MPPLFSSSFFLLLSLSLSTFSYTHADKTPWDVAVSAAQGRDSRFLDVPVYYGNWVPIGNAKATLERVAASIEAEQRKDFEPPVFVDTVDTVKERVDVTPPQWSSQRLKSLSVDEAQAHQQKVWKRPSSTRQRTYR